jgi:hypothetical protein
VGTVFHANRYAEHVFGQRIAGKGSQKSRFCHCDCRIGVRRSHDGGRSNLHRRLSFRGQRAVDINNEDVVVPQRLVLVANASLPAFNYYPDVVIAALSALNLVC